MELNNAIKDKYTRLSDKELVDAIIKEGKHDEEAATFLLWNRYDGLLHKHFYNLIHLDLNEWYDYSVTSLFMYLRGENGEWDKLRNFGWKSKFCYWFKKVSYNHFNDVREDLIEKGVIVVSIDEDGPIDLIDGDVERIRRKTELLEAIAQLQDIDQKFVVLKRLQGYNSKEIACLLQKMWDKNGIVRMDKGHKVEASVGYVDVRMQRAKKELKKIMVSID